MGILDPADVMLELGGPGCISDETRALLCTCIKTAEAAVRRYLQYDPAYGVHTEYYPNIDLSRTSRKAVWEVSTTQAYQRQYSETSTTELQVQNLPVRSVVVDAIRYPRVWIDYNGRSGSRDGSFPDDSLKAEGSDFWPNYDGYDGQGQKICRDGIFKSEGLWPAVSGCVKIMYYAGYTAAELRGEVSQVDALPIWEVAKDETMRRYTNILRKRPNLLGIAGPFQSENLGDYSYTIDAEMQKRYFGGTDLLPQSQEKLADYMNYGRSMMS